MPLAYLDGKFVPADSIKISPFDFGFSRGIAVFEFTRLYGGRPFRLDDHIERFLRGADHLGIRVPIGVDGITKAVQRIAAENKFAHSGIKFYLTAGECKTNGKLGFKRASDFTPHLMMIEDALHPEHPEAPNGMALYERGIALKTVPFSRQISDVKTINYAPGFVAARQLPDDYDEILFCHDAHVAETTMSNFFCIIDGTLHTPAHDRLKGVTRKLILELAKKLKIPAAESDVSLDQLRKASEAFITGTFTEMMPVRRIDDIVFKMTMQAPVFAKLRQAYSAEIAALH